MSILGETIIQGLIMNMIIVAALTFAVVLLRKPMVWMKGFLR